MLLNLECGKLKGLEEVMRTLNESYGEVRLDINCVSSARFPTWLQRMMS